MIEIQGKYNKAKILVADDSKLEEAARKQIYDILNQQFVEGENISIMPDVHAGKSSPIGFTQTITNGKIVPNLVGVDIGCRISVCKVSKEIGDRVFNKSGLEKLDKICRDRVPLGMNHRKTEHRFVENLRLNELRLKGVNVNKSKLALGTGGGGNHFIEIGKDSQGDYYIQIHSGSRNLGVMVCEYYQRKAVQYHHNQKSELLRV